MARYNVQKRATLDRLTLTFQLQAREIFRRETQSIVPDFRDALDAGARSFLPKTNGLSDRLERVFIGHRDRVIHVAVSDGISEVTPGDDPKLGLWQALPATAWIEDTLSVQLANERDKIAKQIQKKAAGKARTKIGSLVDDMLDAYLRNIKDAYRIASRDWLAGESDISDVTEALKRGLRRTDSSAERIFRTETTNYFNESRHDYFSTNTSVDYMQLYAVTDGRISKICEDRHEAVVTIAEAGLRKYMPAFHPHCRTIQRPLISALSTHKRIIERGLELRARHESQWEPAVFAA